MGKKGTVMEEILCFVLVKQLTRAETHQREDVCCFRAQMQPDDSVLEKEI